MIEALHFDGLKMLSNEVQRLSIDCSLERDSGTKRGLRPAEVFIMQDVLERFLLNGGLIAIISQEREVGVVDPRRAV